MLKMRHFHDTQQTQWYFEDANRVSPHADIAACVECYIRWCCGGVRFAANRVSSVPWGFLQGQGTFAGVEEVPRSGLT